MEAEPVEYAPNEAPLLGPACEHPDCTQPAEELWLPDWGGGVAGPYYYCHYHMSSNGWCPGCLNFWAGIESFDFSSTGFCENCSYDNDLYEGEIDGAYDYFG